jgi:hypothetical protein
LDIRQEGNKKWDAAALLSVAAAVKIVSLCQRRNRIHPLIKRFVVELDAVALEILQIR